MKGDIRDALEEIEQGTVAEIAAECYSGDPNCSECGRPTEAFQEFQDRVEANLASMVLDGNVAPTADWEYELVD